MNENGIKIRLMKTSDFDAVVKMDAKVRKVPRPEYYQVRFERLVQSKDYLPTSLVAEAEDGAVVGFVMGELYIGEYGISQDRATLDTIVLDPDYRRRGIGEQLINELMSHLKSLVVRKINTLVDWHNSNLIHFFSANQFSPSLWINIERSF